LSKRQAFSFLTHSKMPNKSFKLIGYVSLIDKPHEGERIKAHIKANDIEEAITKLKAVINTDEKVLTINKIKMSTWPGETILIQ